MESAMQQRPATARGASVGAAAAHAAPHAGLAAIGATLNAGPHVAALGALRAALAPPVSSAAPVQRVLAPLPPQPFFKAAIKPLQPGILATQAQLTTDWATVDARYTELRTHGVVLPRATAFRRMLNYGIPFLISPPFTGAFSGPKCAQYAAEYMIVRNAEAGALAGVQAEFASYIAMDDLALQANSAGRIITQLETRPEPTAADAAGMLFEGGIFRTNAAPRIWDFFIGAQAWTVDIVSAPAMEAGVTTALDAGAHRVTLTINHHMLLAAQQDVFERIIGDALATIVRNLRRAGAGGEARALTRAGVAAAFSTSDLEKIATLRMLHDRLVATQGGFDAAPTDRGRAYNVRQITAQFDALVREMHLDDPAKRALFEQHAGFNAADHGSGVAAKAVSHGIFHEHMAAAPLAPAAPVADDPRQDLGRLGVATITPSLVEHMVAVTGNSIGDFPRMGLSGGHDTLRLQNFVANHPIYHILQTAQQTHQLTLAGVPHNLVVTKFEQFRFTGDPATIGAAARPAAAGVAPANWIIATPVKTTVDNLFTFLTAGRQAYLNWRVANPAKVADRSFGRSPTDPLGPQALGPDNVPFAGYVDNEPVTAVRALKTLFVAG